MGFDRPVSQSNLDPAAFIKKALTSGRAQLDGRTTLRGHEVLRIRLSSKPPFGRPQPIAVYFVDAHSYRPVRVALIAAARPDPYLVGFPLASLSFLPSAVSFGFSHAFVCDFAQYRYLAPSAANRKLTNIRAAHPRAKIVWPAPWVRKLVRALSAPHDIALRAPLPVEHLSQLRHTWSDQGSWLEQTVDAGRERHFVEDLWIDCHVPPNLVWRSVTEPTIERSDLKIKLLDGGRFCRSVSRWVRTSRRIRPLSLRLARPRR